MIFLLGGQNSGKSRLAIELARSYARDQAFTHFYFIATMDEKSQGKDAEVLAKIKAHKKERKKSGIFWQEIEAQNNLVPCFAKISRSSAPESSLVIIDCFSMLVNNLLFDEISQQELDMSKNQISHETIERVQEQLERLVSTIATYAGSLLLVSLEVGLGNVAMDPLTRSYNQMLGWANQRFARMAKKSYWVVAGQAQLLQRIV